MTYLKYKNYETLSEWWEKEGKGKFPVQICIEIAKLQKKDKNLTFKQAFKKLIDGKAIILLPKK